MGRSACCEKVGLKKGPWTPEEDQKLRSYIEEHGHGSWRSLPSKAGLQRCGKSCRLRWTNYLRPDIKRGKFSLQEEQSIIQLHALLGNRWSAIAAHLPKRTDNEIKNYWNTHLKKRLTKMGIDPVTHKPKTDALGSVQSKDAANISHMAQWESARLEAETRLVRESKLLYSNRYQLSQLGSLSTPPPNHQLFNNRTCTPKMTPSLDVIKAWQGAWTTTPRDAHQDENNATLLRSWLSSNGTLESPTSTLNFSEKMMLNIPSIEFTEDVRNNWNQEIELQEIAYPTLDQATYNLDTLRLPSIMENFSDALVSGHKDNANNLISSSIEQHENVDGVGNCGDDFGEKKNYWDNMFDMVTLQSGSPVF